MKKISILTSSILATALLVGCGSDSEDSISSSTYTLSGEDANISTSTAAQQTMASIKSINSLNNTGMDLAPSRQSSARKSMSRKSISLAPVNDTENCTYGGTYTFSGDSTPITNGYSWNINEVYNDCKDNYYILNNETKYYTSNGNMQFIGSSTEVDNLNNYDSNVYLTNYEVSSEIFTSLTNTSMHNTYQSDENSNDFFDKFTINGTMSVSYVSPASTMEIGYSDFIYSESYDSGDFTETIDGKISISSTKDSCSNGIYTFETKEPLSYSSDGYSGGILIVNGTQFEYQNDGTAIVTFADGTSEVVNQESSVTCN